MRLEQLKYIIEIADTGSFTTASERLFIAQPSISQAVTALEKELGTQIFRRSRLGAEPTQIGLQIISYARKSMQQINEIEKLCRTDFAGIHDTITVSAIPTLCSSILPKVISIYKKTFPNVIVKIREDGSKRIRQDVLAGNSEIGLISSHDSQPFRVDGLDYQSLLTGKPMTYVGSASPLANKKCITYEEIFQYPLMLYGEAYSLTEYIIGRLKEYGTPNILSFSRSPESIKKFITQTDAIGFGPDISLVNDPYVENGSVFPIKIDDDHTIQFGLITNNGRPISSACETLIKEILLQADYFSRLYLHRS